VLAVRQELRIAQGPLQALGVDRATGDLQIDLNIHVRRPGMPEATARAQQLGDEPAQDDELGASAAYRKKLG
jgi:hypothetical protein